MFWKKETRVYDRLVDKGLSCVTMCGYQFQFKEDMEDHCPQYYKEKCKIWSPQVRKQHRSSGHSMMYVNNDTSQNLRAESI
jgi:hypothetical protein